MGLKEQLTSCLERAVANYEAAGINLLILRNGEEMCYAQAGCADLGTGKPVARDSIFRLYSQSKPITAAAVMLLIDRGLLDPMACVDWFLPGFGNPKVIKADGSTEPALRSPWILELLTMTAGVYYPDADPAGQPARGTAAGVPSGNRLALQHLRRYPRRGGGSRQRETFRAVPEG